MNNSQVFSMLNDLMEARQRARETKDTRTQKEIQKIIDRLAKAVKVATQ